MIVKRDYDQIIRENFDLTDSYTRKYIATLEDAQQEQLIDALSAALYDKIVAKVDEIDFGSIPKSRGDITKVQGFENNKKCIEIIRKLIVEYHQNPASVDTVSSAIQNVVDRKALFVKAYGMNAEFPMVIYNLITLAIYRSVSFLIASCIEYIKDPNSSNMKMALDVTAYKKSAEDVMFKQLSGFNNLCKDGTMDSLIRSTLTVVKESIEIFSPGDIANFGVRLDPDDGESPFDSGSSIELYKFGDDPCTNPDKTIPANVPNDLPDGYDDFTREPAVGIPDPDSLEFEDPDPDEGFDDDVLAMFNDDIADDVQYQNIPSDTPEDDDDIDHPTEPVHEFSFKDAGTKVGGLIDAGASKLGKLIDNVQRNGSGADGKFKLSKYISNYNKAKKVAIGIAGGATLALLLVKVIIPSAKHLVYDLLYAGMKFSDYLEIQAQMLEAHADEVEHYSDMDENKKQKVANKQRKWAERLKKWSNIFAMDRKQSKNKADAEAKKDDQDKRRVGQDNDGDDVLF